ncbi:MAG TPA: 4-hydroxy-tetrahydrodipicolinate reductase [Candidatus Obscuribacterales bacterium]
MTTTINVAIAGVNGRMGRAFVQAFLASPAIKIVGAFGRENADYVGEDIAQVAAIPGQARTGILVSNGFLDCVERATPDVVLDFTNAEAAWKTANLSLQRGIRPVIGTSGLSQEHVKELGIIAEKKKVGAMVVPNFSVGAVLMMEFARQAGRFLPNVEVVEMHHTGKVDAPSGTAMHTATKLAASRDHYNAKKIDERELLPGARGGVTPSGVRVHSLRLPGLISHQEVIFGAEGELLTIRHDSFNTKCFLEGIRLAVEHVMKLDKLVVGLDNVLFATES